MRLLRQFKLCIFFFLQKDLVCTKSTKKHEEVLKALKALNGTKTLGQKHKNANKRISEYFPLRCFLGTFFFFCL